MLHRHTVLSVCGICPSVESMPEVVLWGRNRRLGGWGAGGLGNWEAGRLKIWGAGRLWIWEAGGRAGRLIFSGNAAPQIKA